MKDRRIGAAAIIDTPHPPKKQERETKRKKAQKQEREGSNPLIWSPTAVNSKLLIGLLYTTCGIAVKRYIIATAAAVRTESDHTKSHKSPNYRNEKNRMGFSTGKKR